MYFSARDGNNYNGCIIKTTNGIDYTFVTFVTPHTTQGTWELAIEIIGNKMPVLIRNSRHLFIYDLIAKTWEVKENYVGDRDLQRMAMHYKDGHLYIFHNITPVVKTGWATIRNNVRVMKVDPVSYVEVARQEFAVPAGFHYYGFADYREQTYCYFTQDLRNLNPSDPKTDIAVMTWQDLVNI